MWVSMSSASMTHGGQILQASDLSAVPVDGEAIVGLHGFSVGQRDD